MNETSAAAPVAIPRIMCAAALFGPGEFRIVDKPVPPPAEGEVLVKIAMCGTCGTDLKIQEHPFPGQPPYGQFTPVTNGPDGRPVGRRSRRAVHRRSRRHRSAQGLRSLRKCVVGRYTACLNNGNRAKGHRASGLTADGGFAEYAVHHINALYRMPDNVTWEDAVLVTTAGTGLYGLDRAGGFIVGESVVIIGPGRC